MQLTLTKDENLHTAPNQLHGLLVLGDGRAYEIRATPGALASVSLVQPSSGMLRIVLLAFVGGVILNLMPCVFPVLFIKGLALVQSSAEERHKLRLHGLVYTLGILASFWLVVGVLLALRGAGHNLGWGFQFQSPTFDALIAMLLFFLGLSLAGQFEIGLTLTSAGSGLAAKQGYTGSFFTGVLAVIVATPCTAPFMGAAIGYALSNSALVSFAVFTALALGLAAPYLLLAFNPAWTRLLPRPGAWMEILKQATSVPIFATVIWLIWVYTQTAGPSALVDLLAAFLLLAIAGWILGRWPAKAPATAIAALVLAGAVALPVAAVRRSGDSPATATAATSDTQWAAFTPELVAKYRSEGRPVFVDFTASWCLSCQVNERVVLNRPDVQERLKTSGVALVRADWTRHDEVIAQTLASLGRDGVPTYVLIPADPQAPPILLPEVLTQGIVFKRSIRSRPVRFAPAPGCRNFSNKPLHKSRLSAVRRLLFHANPRAPLDRGCYSRSRFHSGCFRRSCWRCGSGLYRHRHQRKDSTSSPTTAANSSCWSGRITAAPTRRKHYNSGNMQALQKEWTAKGVVWLTILSSAPGEQGYMTASEENAYISKVHADPTARYP